MTSGSPTSFESATPTRIGAGSFATVFSVRGQPFVYKVIHHSQRADELRAEITALHCLYLRCNSTSMFAIPRAFAYHNPDTGELVQFPPSPLIGGLRELRPWVNQDTFHGFTSAAYIMDRAHALPVRIANVVRDQFYPAAAIAQGVESPLMCRLYFGKVIRPSKFVNSINFPLDVHRYKSLLGSCEPGSLFTAKEVAVGMGEMLGWIHWLCGYDGRDIEFVLAGSGYPGTVRYFVIDFNQVCSMSLPPCPITEDAPLLGS